MASSSNGPPSIEVSAINGLLAALHITPSQGPVIFDVVPYASHTVNAERELSGLQFPFTLYAAKFQTPVISEPSPYYETASDSCRLEFSGMLIASVDDDRPITQPHAFRPMRDWPTIAIEFGAWASRPVLREKARWWIKASNYEVKIVLLFLVDEVHEKVDIEKWTISQLPSRHGALVSYPSPSQHIIMTEAASGGFDSWNGPLRLKFEDLFRREPTQGLEGGDVIINNRELQHLALATWRSMKIR